MWHINATEGSTGGVALGSIWQASLAQPRPARTFARRAEEHVQGTVVCGTSNVTLMPDTNASDGS